MLRWFDIAVITVSIAQVPSAFAAPSGCGCESLCWGWPGFVKGNNPWGVVLSPSESTALSSALSASCTATSDSSTVATSSLSAKLIAGTVTVELTSSTSTSVFSTTEKFSTSSSVVTSSTAIQFKVTSSSNDPVTTSSEPPTSTPSSTPVPTSTSTSSKQISSTPRPSSSSFSEPAPSPTPASSSNSGSNGGSASDTDVNEYLSVHNNIRNQHGASDLAWNNTLAVAAQKWSDNCVFKHSGGTLGPFGENLAAGTGDSYGITSAVSSWTNEASQYNPSSPSASHFTQVVWKASTQVGCAETSCPGGTIFDSNFGNSKFFVCEYFPQGNVIGAFAANVQA